jgi:hypothetical protein
MTRERLADRWSDRDFPVLLAVARRLDGGAMPVAVSDIKSDLEDVTDDGIIAALKGLVHGYILGKPIDTMGGTVDFFVTDLTERGRRAAGLWPTGESADALVDALRQAEELTDDSDEKTMIRRAAGAIGSVSRDIMVDVLAAVVARQSGLG